MSGGSYDYTCFKIRDLSENIISKNDPRRIAFKKLLMLVSEAAQAIEWVDSCDFGPGDEHKPIDDCLSFLESSPEIIAKAHAYDEFQKMVSSFLSLTPAPSGDERGES